MPSMLSSCMCRRKHDDIWGLAEPALNSVGVAWVKNFDDIRW